MCDQDESSSGTSSLHHQVISSGGVERVREERRVRLTSEAAELHVSLAH